MTKDYIRKMQAMDKKEAQRKRHEIQSKWLSVAVVFTIYCYYIGY